MSSAIEPCGNCGTRLHSTTECQTIQPALTPILSESMSHILPPTIPTFSAYITPQALSQALEDWAIETEHWAVSMQNYTAVLKQVVHGHSHVNFTSSQEEVSVAFTSYSGIQGQTAIRVLIGQATDQVLANSRINAASMTMAAASKAQFSVPAQPTPGNDCAHSSYERAASGPHAAALHPSKLSFPSASLPRLSYKYAEAGLARLYDPSSPGFGPTPPLTSSQPLNAVISSPMVTAAGPNSSQPTKEAGAPTPGKRGGAKARGEASNRDKITKLRAAADPNKKRIAEKKGANAVETETKEGDETSALEPIEKPKKTGNGRGKRALGEEGDIGAPAEKPRKKAKKGNDAGESSACEMKGNGEDVAAELVEE